MMFVLNKPTFGEDETVHVPVYCRDVYTIVIDNMIMLHLFHQMPSDFEHVVLAYNCNG